LLSSGDDGLLRLCASSTGLLLHDLSGHRGRIVSSSFSSDDRFVIGVGSDGTVRTWDVATGEPLPFYACHLPDGEFAVLRTDGSGAVQVSRGGWRWRGWQVPDPETGEVRRYPAEMFGPLPEWTPPTD